MKDILTDNYTFPPRLAPITANESASGSAHDKPEGLGSNNQDHL